MIKKENILVLCISNKVWKRLYSEYKLGTLLLDDAFSKIEMAHGLVAGRYILVDAINNEKVLKFYTEYGFALLDTNVEESENGSTRMIYKI